MTSSATVQFHEANLESVIFESELDFADKLPKFDFQSREFAFAVNRHHFIEELRQLADFLVSQHLKSARLRPLLLIPSISIHLPLWGFLFLFLLLLLFSFFSMLVSLFFSGRFLIYYSFSSKIICVFSLLIFNFSSSKYAELRGRAEAVGETSGSMRSNRLLLYQNRFFLFLFFFRLFYLRTLFLYSLLRKRFPFVFVYLRSSGKKGKITLFHSLLLGR